jgi:hypothetical protein
VFTAVALPAFIHRFPVTHYSQLRKYSDVQKLTRVVRNITKHSYISVVKTLMTNNRQTCPSVFSDLRGTHKRRDLSVMYLIVFILLSHLQLIRPLYELFLEIIKAFVGRFRKCHQLTGKRQRKFCVQVAGVEESILVISTDPSVTIQNCAGQVVHEGCYQIFIYSTLNSSCGQLKGKHCYWRNASPSLELNCEYG